MDIVSNRFGTVAADRVTFNLKKGWFSGSLKSDYLTKHITSIALDVSRRPIWGAIFALAGSWAMTSSLMFMGIFLFLIGVYFVLGRPTIHFATAGGERIISYGAWPWQQAEAQQFVDALKKELFKQEAAS